MKKFYLFCLCLVSFALFSQNARNISLEWNGSSQYANEDFTFKYPVFSSLHFSVDVTSKKIYYKELFNVNGKIDVSSLRIENIRYQNISEDELFNLEKNQIPSSIGATIESFSARGEYKAMLVFSPIIKEGNIYKKVISLQYSFTYQGNAARSSFSNQTLAVTNSVLSSGSWYRFYVEKSGIYRVSKQFLQSLGMNVNVDPRNIKIYGAGGRMVPLLNSTSYPLDLEENAIQFVGESDGVFNDNDYILFYAEGVDVWNRESLTSVNLFSDRAYYYVTSSGGSGKRIQEAIQPVASPTLSFTAFDQMFTYEKDLVNIGKVGRRWFGEQFNINPSQIFTFDFPNLITSEPIIAKINLASKSFGNTSFTVRANNQVIGSVPFLALTAGSGIEGLESALNTSFNAAGSTITISLEYTNGGVPSSNGYLDFIQLNVKRNLRGYGKQFEFYNYQQEANIGVGEYVVSNANSISQVWDITDIFNVQKYSNANQTNFSFKVPLGAPKKYIALDGADLYFPLKEANSVVQNQNLKGTVFNNASNTFQDIDCLIITPFALRNQAEILANFHRNISGLVVKVVTIESIYHEFSSGKQDVGAIRNFIRYVYWNASVPEKRVKYVNRFWGCFL